MTKDNKFAPGKSSLAIGIDAFRLLQEENLRLKALLKKHGIPWEEDQEPIEESCAPPLEQPTHLSTDQKVTLFRRLFRGRTDIYPTRWKSAKGRSGYSPVCGNEWKTGLFNKPKVSATSQSLPGCGINVNEVIVQ